MKYELSYHHLVFKYFNFIVFLIQNVVEVMY